MTATIQSPGESILGLKTLQENPGPLKPAPDGESGVLVRPPPRVHSHVHAATSENLRVPLQRSSESRPDLSNGSPFDARTFQTKTKDPSPIALGKNFSVDDWRNKNLTNVRGSKPELGSERNTVLSSGTEQGTTSPSLGAKQEDRSIGDEPVDRRPPPPPPIQVLVPGEQGGTGPHESSNRLEGIAPSGADSVNGHQQPPTSNSRDGTSVENIHGHLTEPKAISQKHQVDGKDSESTSPATAWENSITKKSLSGGTSNDSVINPIVVDHGVWKPDPPGTVAHSHGGSWDGDARAAETEGSRINPQTNEFQPPPPPQFKEQDRPTTQQRLYTTGTAGAHPQTSHTHPLGPRQDGQTQPRQDVFRPHVYPQHHHQQTSRPGHRPQRPMQQNPNHRQQWGSVPQGVARFPQRQPPPQQQPSSRRWTRLWRRIEGGLDSLADMEESVAGRVNKLYSATVETASSAIKAVPQLASVRPSGPSHQAVDDDLDAHTETNFRIPVRPLHKPSMSRETKTPPDQSLTARHELMRKQQAKDELQRQDNKSSVDTNNEDTQSEKKIDWNQLTSGKTKRPILATGGASSVPVPNPNDVDPRTSYSSGQFQGHQPSPPFQSPTSNTFSSNVDSNIRDDHRRKVQAMLQNTGAPTPSTGSSSSRQQEGGHTHKASAAKRYSFEDDDEDSTGWTGKLVGLLPRIPSLNILRLRQSSYQDYAATMDAWSAEDGESERGLSFLGFGRRKRSRAVFDVSPGTSKEKDSPRITSTVDALKGRSHEWQTATLLKDFERKRCVVHGRNRALFDLASLVFGLQAAREFFKISSQISVPSGSFSIEGAMLMGEKLVDGWSPYAATGTFLAIVTNVLLLERANSAISSSVANQVSREAEYGSLFLRLVLSIPTKKHVVQKVAATARAQAAATIEATRLSTFVICLVVSLVVTTLSFLQPLLIAAGKTFIEIVSIEDWRSWPIPWQSLWGVVRKHIMELLLVAKSVVAKELNLLLQQPFRYAGESSLLIAMVLVTLIPRFEMSRKPVGTSSASEEEDAVQYSHEKQTDNVWNLGSSSASRLQLVSKRFELDEFLERWRTSTPVVVPRRAATSERSPLFIGLYGTLGGLLLCVPLVVFAATGVLDDVSQGNLLVRWHSLREVAAVLVVLQALFLSAIGRAVEASVSKKTIAPFLSSFLSAVDERAKQIAAPPANLQLQASISPTAGIVVRDMWTAHSKRRAWAVHGANLSCRSGEVVVVLGDDGSGKTRLMASLAEAIVHPPKQAQTVVHVRGSISLGGLDVTKWDPNHLRRRVGLMLNDVRTVADFSRALSGLSIEEILEPSDGLHLQSPSQPTGSKGSGCMALALKMTGLDSSLLPRLSSKLATVVTANEEDLEPSPLRPHYCILSSVEWSKLLLARVLCQTMYDNESAAATNDRVENSLLGSLLLLDDATVPFSETDEGPLFRNLRSSMAATILTSTRWATGRWADRVVVLQDGVVVETGSHNELLSRGPQHSLYAAKWAAMT